MKAVPPKFVLMMSSAGGKSEPIAESSFEMELTELINRIAKALQIAQFRGLVHFTVLKDQVASWESEITYTDDLPAGYWNTIHN